MPKDKDEFKININSGDSEDKESEKNTSEQKILDDDGTVTIRDDEDRSTVILVGTVHVSKKTKERVIDTIEQEKPDVVGIELDQERLKDMFNRSADIVDGDVEEDNKFGFQDIIKKQQKKQLSSDEFLDPGEADMMPAVKKGVDLNRDIALIDMSVKNLKSNIKNNAYNNGKLDLEILNKSFGELAESVKNLVRSRSEMAEKVQEDGLSSVVEQLETSSLDEVNEQIEPLRDIAPELVEALIDERDKYMAGRLHWMRNNGYKCVGIMGRGHITGVYNYLENPDNIPQEYIKEPDWYNYNKIDIN